METATNMPKRFYRNKKHSVLGGVGAGLADYTGLDVVLWRVIIILLAFSGVGIIAYLILWIIVPVNPDPDQVQVPVSRDYSVVQQIAGLFLVGIGVIWFIENLELYYVDQFFETIDPYRFPVILILAGTAILYYSFNRKKKEDTMETAQNENPRRLIRTRKDKWIAGVCGGLGLYFNIDPVLVRIGFIISAFISLGASVVIYLILALMTPKEDTIV